MKESRYSKFIKNRILMFCVLLLIVCISFGVSYSNFVINGTEQRAVEMFAGGLKYTMSLNDTTANSILVEPGTTTATIDVTSASSVPYKYVLTNSINENIEVISFSEDASGTIEPNESKSIEVEITNNSENNINISFELASGYTTNEISDIEFKSGFTSITIIGSTNSYLDKTKFRSFVTNNSPTEIYFTITGHSTGTDLSSDPTEPIYAWMEEDKMYVSAKDANKKVSAPVDSSYLFSGSICEKFKDVKKVDVEYLNTKNVTNMSYMFEDTGYNATTFELNLSNWNTSNVTNMSYMFFYTGYNATNWNIGDLSNWNTSNVTNMSYMFNYAGYRTTTFKLNLGSWDTSNVTNMSNMFDYAGFAAKTWNIGNISNWDTSNVTNMSCMFNYAGYRATTFKLNLGSWDTSQVTNMSDMFREAGRNATTFEIKIPKRSNGITDNTTTSLYGSSTSVTPPTGRLFTIKLPSTTSYLDKTKFQNFVTNNSPTEIYFTISGHSTGTDISNDSTEPIYAWMEGIKMYVSAREPNKLIKAPVDLSSFFSGSLSSKFRAVSTIDVTNLDTSKVTDMSYMFYFAGDDVSSFKIVGLEKLNTSNVINMSHLFEFAGYLSSVNYNVTGWDTSKVTDMSYMFSISGRYGNSAIITGLDTWDTSNVTNMSEMFCKFGWEARSVVDIGDISNWDTSNVTNMNCLFYGLGWRYITSFEINLSNWDTSNVTDMGGMFYKVASDKGTKFKVDISGFDTSKVKNMNNMFSGSYSSATTFEIKIPKRSNGTADNTATSLKGLSTSATPPSGKSFTLVD